MSSNVLSFTEYIKKIVEKKLRMQNRALEIHREEAGEYKELAEADTAKILEMASQGGVVTEEYFAVIEDAIKNEKTAGDVISGMDCGKHKALLLAWEAVVGPRSGINFVYQFDDGFDIDNVDDTMNINDMIREKSRAHQHTYEGVIAKYEELIKITEDVVNDIGDDTIEKYESLFEDVLKKMTRNEKKAIKLISGYDDEPATYEEAAMEISTTAEQMKKIETKALRKSLNRADFPEVNSIKDPLL